MNRTPETDAMASMQRTHQEWRAHSETLERERDEWKEEADDRLALAPCSLLPCGCGGRVGSRAAVKFHPRLNIIDGVTSYDVRCARCKKIATTKNGAGFENWKAALRAWNHKANADASPPSERKTNAQ